MKNILKQGSIEIHKGVETLDIKIIDWNDKEVEYIVENTPICQWDQHSRARIGVEFLDYKVSDTPKYIMYTHIFDKINSDEQYKQKVFATLEKLENIRKDKDSFKVELNLMSRSCSYRVKQTFESLKGQMMRRLKACEEEFITGLHILLREKLIQLGCKQALDFKPGCDILEKCDYSSADYLSNMFGCLFAGCGRWPSETNFASFNFSCSTYTQLNKQLNTTFPLSKYELANVIQQ